MTVASYLPAVEGSGQPDLREVFAFQRLRTHNADQCEIEPR